MFINKEENNTPAERPEIPEREEIELPLKIQNQPYFINLKIPKSQNQQSPSYTLKSGPPQTPNHKLHSPKSKAAQ